MYCMCICLCVNSSYVGGERTYDAALTIMQWQYTGGSTKIDDKNIKINNDNLDCTSPLYYRKFQHGGPWLTMAPH